MKLYCPTNDGMYALPARNNWRWQHIVLSQS